MADYAAANRLGFSRHPAAASGHARGCRRRGERRRTAAADLGHGRNDFYQNNNRGSNMRIQSGNCTAVAAASLAVPGAFAQTTHVRRACGRRRSSTPKSPYLGIGVKDIDSESAKKLNLKEVRGVEITQRRREQSRGQGRHQGRRRGAGVQRPARRRRRAVSRLVRETPVGRQVKIGVWRNGSMQTLTATRRASTKGNDHSPTAAAVRDARRFTFRSSSAISKCPRSRCRASR